jgi:hypothetical protein
MALANTVQALEELTQTLQFCCVSQLCVTVVRHSCVLQLHQLLCRICVWRYLLCAVGQLLAK